MMAAPTKYNRARVKKILDAVRLGQPYMRAAHVAGIHYDTFREWRKDNPELSVALDAATAEGELHVLGSLRQASNDGNVSAMLGWLERRFPDDWSRGERLKQEVSGTLDIRKVIRNTQAALDAVLPNDPAIRERFAEKLAELGDTEEAAE